MQEVWEKDLEKRRQRTKSSDTELAGDELDALLAQDGDDNEERFGELGQGDYFGELGLIHGKPKTMSVWCTQDTHLLYLDRISLQLIIDTYKSRIALEKI